MTIEADWPLRRNAPCAVTLPAMLIARRQLLTLGAAGLAAPAFVRHARAADVQRFGLGVASGHPQPESVVLWTRLTGLDLPAQLPVRWQIAHDEAFSRIVASGTETAEPGTAHSVHAEVAGLAPGRAYFYRFSALGQQSATGRTRTAPAPDAPTTLHAVLASCQRWDHGLYAAWRDVAARAPDLVMFVGDYIYEYASAEGVVRPHDGPLVRTLDQYRARYAQYKSDPLLQAAHAAAPWMVVWDDHEVENDYANEDASTLFGAALLRLRAAAYQAWWEHQPVPKAMRPVGPDARIFHRLDWGRLARLHALDGRQYRDIQACRPMGRLGGASSVDADACLELQDPKRSMLGAAQERWLAEGWDRERPWNLLAQQTLMARNSRTPVSGPRTGRYWTDSWDGYPLARQRLLQGAADRRLGGAVVLSGDVHAFAVADLKADAFNPDAPTVASELCGTSISSRGMPQVLLDRLRPHNPHLLHARSDQRGYLALNLTERELRADLMVVQDPLNAFSPVEVSARFVVEHGRPGPQRA